MVRPTLPAPLAGDERFARLCQMVWDLYGDLDLEKILVYLVDIVSEDVLPVLGEQFHVMGEEGWKLAKTADQRRELIKRSIELHRQKGTPWSIREALKAVGFDDIDIEEGLPSNRYDGQITYSGADTHSAYGWAQFRMRAAPGDDQPVTAEQTALIVQTVNAWKPARSQLVDVRYGVDITDEVDVSDMDALRVDLKQSDEHRWGVRFHDGTLRYDQGNLHTFNGQLRFDGARAYDGYSAAPGKALYEGEREHTALAAALALSDQQMRCASFDGGFKHDGVLDFGASAPVAEDLPMQIVVRQHRRYDGRMAYGRHRYDGAARYTGAFTHFGNTAYSGDAVTTLEA